MIKKIVTIGVIAMLSVLSMTTIFANGIDGRLIEGEVVDNKVLVTATNLFDKGEVIPLDIESYIIAGDDKLIVKESYVSPPRTKVSFDIIYDAGRTYSTVEEALVGQIAVFTMEDYNSSEYSVNRETYPVIKKGKTAIVAIPADGVYFLDDNVVHADFMQVRKNLIDIVTPYELDNGDRVVKGQKTEYEFAFPEGLNFLVYNNEYSNTNGVVEKVNFSLDTGALHDKYFTLFELHTYTTRDFAKTSGIFKIGEKNGYVYGIKMNNSNDTITVSSKEQYDAARKLLTSNNYQVLKDSLSLPMTPAEVIEVARNTSSKEVEEKTEEKLVEEVGKEVGKEIEETKEDTEEIEETVTQEDQANERLNTLHINGELTDIEYILIEDQIYFPLRSSMEIIGFEIGWDADNKAISFTNEEVKGRLQVNSNIYVNDDVTIKLEKAVKLVDNTSYVPVEFFAGVMPYHYVVRDSGAVFLILE